MFYYVSLQLSSYISKFNMRTSALIDRKTSRPINMLVRTRRRAKYVFISVIVSALQPSLAAASGQKNPDCGDTKRDNTGKNEMVAMITPSPHSSYSYYFASNINSFFQTYLRVCFLAIYQLICVLLSVGSLDKWHQMYLSLFLYSCLRMYLCVCYSCKLEADMCVIGC